MPPKATTQTPITQEILLAARLSLTIFGREETERALAEVHGLDRAAICCIMQQLAASEN